MQLESLVVKRTVRKSGLPRDGIRIVPIADIQYDGTDRSAWDKLQKMVNETSKDPGTYYIGLGDYIDVASPSNRTSWAGMKKYESLVGTMEREVTANLNTLKQILAPTKGRWLGLIQGHHYWPFSTGGTSDERLAEFLEAPFLGDCAIVQVEFEKHGKHKTPSFKLWIHHGEGGGDPIKKLERLAGAFDANCFLIGHNHVKASKKISRVEAVFGEYGGQPRLKDREILLVSVGSYLKGYMQDSKGDGRWQGGYVEKKLLIPVALGHVVIEATPKLTNDGYSEVELKAYL